MEVESTCIHKIKNKKTKILDVQEMEKLNMLNGYEAICSVYMVEVMLMSHMFYKKWFYVENEHLAFFSSVN